MSNCDLLATLLKSHQNMQLCNWHTFSTVYFILFTTALSLGNLLLAYQPGGCSAGLTERQWPDISRLKKRLDSWCFFSSPDKFVVTRCWSKTWKPLGFSASWSVLWGDIFWKRYHGKKQLFFRHSATLHVKMTLKMIHINIFSPFAWGRPVNKMGQYFCEMASVLVRAV